MKDIKIVFSDLDGTLLDGNSKLTIETLDAIKKLREKGIKFGVASGRDIELIRYQFAEDLIDYIDVIIGENGYEIKSYLEDSISYGDIIDAKDLPDILSLVDKYEGTGIIAHEGNLISYGTYSYIWQNTCVKPYEICTKEEMLKYPVSKICCLFPDTYTQQLHDEFDNQDPSKSYYATFSGPSMLEFQHVTTSKGQGLDRFLKKASLTKENVCFFGDAGNDIDMMLHVGRKIAMKNATKEVIEIADEVTEYTNAENGVAKHLIKLFNL